MRKSATTIKNRDPWKSLSNTDLLDLKIRDLGLQLEQTPLQRSVNKIHRELESKGFVFFRPEAYLGDEWFCPEGSTLISIPFYLADQRLCKLEKSMTKEVEGGTPKWREKLLRHEAGHCFDHAYEISSKPEWKLIFGDRNKRYNTERYHSDPKSTDFVHNLEDCYAQAHPLEDFAETFAVWLDPKNNWRQSYRKMPLALQKLKFVNDQVRYYARKKPFNAPGTKIFAVNNLRSTLKQYYGRRRIKS